MKRFRLLIFVLAAMLCFAACTKEANTDDPVQATPEPTAEPTATELPVLTSVPTEVPTPEPTPEPTPTPTPEPETIDAVVKAPIGLLAKTFALGDTVEVTGEWGDYAVIADLEEGELLIDKMFLRIDGKQAASYKGYAQANAEVYDNPYMTGAPIAKPNRNTEIAVDDTMGGVVRVTLADGRTGYMRAAGISKTKPSSGGGGGGGGSSSGGQDGQDIHLGSFGTRGGETVRLGARVLFADKLIAGTYVVLADGVEAYYYIYDRGEDADVTEKGAPLSSLLNAEKIGTVPTELLRFEGEAAYKEWTGYAKNKAPFFKTYRRIDVPTELKQNTEVKVLEELSDCYVVELNNVIGFMDKDVVSKNKIASGGGKGGGSSSGGEWTDPVL
ncbi:MAG: hypothetical protein Q4A88_07475 [Clostridia bacterium]|nr:hypothetical protein [Clostridia bacterium]